MIELTELYWLWKYSNIFVFKEILAKTEADMINIVKEENVEVTALEDPKNLKCGDSARKLALDVVEVITKKQK